MKKVKFTIDPTGEVSMDVLGTVGAECDSLTNPFEAVLGTVGRKERKDSFYATEESVQVENSLGGSA